MWISLNPLRKHYSMLLLFLFQKLMMYIDIHSKNIERISFVKNLGLVLVLVHQIYCCFIFDSHFIYSLEFYWFTVCAWCIWINCIANCIFCFVFLIFTIILLLSIFSCKCWSFRTWLFIDIDFVTRWIGLYLFQRYALQTWINMEFFHCTTMPIIGWKTKVIFHSSMSRWSFRWWHHT